MTRRPATVTVTAERPDGTPLTLYTTGPQDGPAPAGTITITWGRPTPRDHSDAGRIQLRIAAPATMPMDDLAPDTKLTITVTLPTWMPAVVAVGWITEWRRHDDALGVAWYDITLEDVIDHAANSLVADTPWPQESTFDRVGHINAASTAGALIDPNGPFTLGTCAPRDVDRRNVRELAHLTIDPGHQAHPSPYGGIQGDANGGYWAPDTALISPRRRAPRDDGVVTIPTDAVLAASLIMTRGKRLTHVELTCPDATLEPVTVTLAADTTALTTARHTIETDQLDKDTNDDSAIYLEAPYWVNESKKVLHHLPPTRLILDRINDFALTAIINLAERAVNVVYLDGPLKYPINRCQIITAATLTLHGPGIDSLEVEMQDARLAGIRGITWRYFQTPPRLTSFLAYPPDKLTFRKSRTIHIGKDD